MQSTTTDKGPQVMWTTCCPFMLAQSLNLICMRLQDGRGRRLSHRINSVSKVFSTQGPGSSHMATDSTRPKQSYPCIDPLHVVGADGSHQGCARENLIGKTNPSWLKTSGGCFAFYSGKASCGRGLQGPPYEEEGRPKGLGGGGGGGEYEPASAA